jgi:CRP-like cAMP-binding protein
MPSVRPLPAVPGNRLLAVLPEAEYHRLLPLLKPVKLAFKQVLYEYRGPIDYVYFPTGAVLSALTIMADGSAIEVATVGNEGLIGHSTSVGGHTSPTRVIVQIGNGGLRVEAKAFREEVARPGPLQDLLTDYLSAFLSQVSQSVACNGLHRLEQRCCRWLLMTLDRVSSNDMQLTHEFLAIMLGARRASVTETLRPLQDAHLVRSQRGRISILDRAGLEARACECYGIVKADYDRLLGGKTWRRA